MYMTNEEWEQNNQDYLKESYEKTGFTIGGYAIRKLICGGCGRVFYTTIYTKKYCHSYWCGNQANNRRQLARKNEGNFGKKREGWTVPALLTGEMGAEQSGLFERIV